MITQSGALVLPNNYTSPTLEDIAVHLGRHPRWGGATSRWWPVLLHLLLCRRIAKTMRYNSRIRLLALLHDGHEAVRGDIPAPWKDDHDRELEWGLDVRIFRNLRIPMQTDWEAATIHLVDMAARRAEAWVLGPPGIREYMSLNRVPEGTRHVRDLCKVYKDPRSTDGLKSPGVQYYIRIVTEEFMCQ